MSLLSPAMQRLDAGDRASPEFLRCLELAGVENSLDNLLTYPWIRGRVQCGELHLHGAYFGRAGGSWCAIRQTANSGQWTRARASTETDQPFARFRQFGAKFPLG